MTKIKNRIKSLNIRKPVELFVYALALLIVLIINFLQIPRDQLQAEYEQINPGTQPVVVNPTAFIYPEPVNSATPIDSLSVSDEVTVIYSENGWSRVQIGSIDGWIENINISHLYTALLDQEVVLVHSELLQGSEATTVHDSQLAVIVLEESDGWARVKYNEQSFWIQTHHLQPVTGQSGNWTEGADYSAAAEYNDLNLIASRYEMKTEYLKSHANIPDTIKAAILSGTCVEGMTREEVAVSLGQPGEMNRIGLSRGITEQWVYTHGNWQTFVNFSDNTIQNWWQVSANLAQR